MQSPPSENSSVHPLLGSLGGFRWEVPAERPDARRCPPLAAGQAVPGDAGSWPTPPPPEIPREQWVPCYPTLGARRSTRRNGNRQRFDLEGLAPPPLPGAPGSHARRPAEPGCCSPEPVLVLRALLSIANGRTKWPGPMAAAKVARAVEPIKVQLYVSPALETPGAGRSAKSANQ